MTVWRVVFEHTDPEQDYLDVRRVYRVGAETAVEAFSRAFGEWVMGTPQTVNGFTVTVERDEPTVLPAPGRPR